MLNVVIHAHPAYFPRKENIKGFFTRFPEANIYIFHPAFENLSMFCFNEVIESIMNEYPNVNVFPTDGVEDVCHLPGKFVVYDVAENPLGQLAYSWKYAITFSYGENGYVAWKQERGPADLNEVHRFYDEDDDTLLLPVVSLSGGMIPHMTSVETEENIRLLLIDVIHIILGRADKNTVDQTRRRIFGYHATAYFGPWLEHFIKENGIPFDGNLYKLLRLFQEQPLNKVIFTHEYKSELPRISREETVGVFEKDMIAIALRESLKDIKIEYSKILDSMK